MTKAQWPTIRDEEVNLVLPVMITQYSSAAEAEHKARIYVDPRECTSEEWKQARRYEFEKLIKHGAIETVIPTKEMLEKAVVIPIREVDEIKDYGKRKKARFATRGDFERKWRKA